MKHVTQDNLLERDPTWDFFVKSDGTKLEQQDLIKVAQGFELIEEVHTDVKDIFYVAKSLFAYSYFQYIFMTVALDHILKACELSVRTVYASSFEKDEILAKMINELHKKKIINTDLKEKLHRVRHLRNSAAHPQFQRIMPLGMAVEFFRYATEAINELFVSIKTADN